MASFHVRQRVPTSQSPNGIVCRLAYQVKNIDRGTQVLFDPLALGNLTRIRLEPLPRDLSHYSVRAAVDQRQAIPTCARVCLNTVHVASRR
jgi:hypothetical protein